jgi:hypothetical protein
VVTDVMKEMAQNAAKDFVTHSPTLQELAEEY